MSSLRLSDIPVGVIVIKGESQFVTTGKPVDIGHDRSLQIPATPVSFMADFASEVVKYGKVFVIREPRFSGWASD